MNFQSFGPLPSAATHKAEKENEARHVLSLKREVSQNICVACGQELPEEKSVRRASKQGVNSMENNEPIVSACSYFFM